MFRYFIEVLTCPIPLVVYYSWCKPLNESKNANENLLRSSRELFCFLPRSGLFFFFPLMQGAIGSKYLIDIRGSTMKPNEEEPSAALSDFLLCDPTWSRKFNFLDSPVPLLSWPTAICVRPFASIQERRKNFASTTDKKVYSCNTHER